VIKWDKKRAWIWRCDWCRKPSPKGFKTEQEAKDDYSIHLARVHNAN